MYSVERLQLQLTRAFSGCEVCMILFLLVEMDSLLYIIFKERGSDYVSRFGGHHCEWVGTGSRLE